MSSDFVDMLFNWFLNIGQRGGDARFYEKTNGRSQGPEQSPEVQPPLVFGNTISKINQSDFVIKKSMGGKN